MKLVIAIVKAEDLDPLLLRLEEDGGVLLSVTDIRYGGAAVIGAYRGAAYRIMSHRLRVEILVVNERRLCDVLDGLTRALSKPAQADGEWLVVDVHDALRVGHAPVVEAAAFVT